jgi:hypothetical protein
MLTHKQAIELLVDHKYSFGMLAKVFNKMADV